MSILATIKNHIEYKKKLRIFQNKWREKNKNNFTSVGEIIPDVVDIGKGTYGCVNIRWFCDKQEHLTIGNFCSIAEGVLFLTGGNHPMKTLSSYPFDTYYTNYSHVAPTKGPIVVGDDVWIGLNSIQLFFQE